MAENCRMAETIAQSIANDLSCINDCAGCGVALLQSLNNIARDESQKLCTLQCVEKHGKTFVTLTTTELLDM